MRRRIAIVAGGAAALAFSLVTANPAAVAQMSPGMFAAMQHDFGLSAQQVQTRLGQEKDATGILPAAQQAAGAAFGGAWFDAARGKLVVGVTDSSVAAAVERTGAATVPSRVSAAALDGAKKALDDSAKAQPAPPSVSSWRTDPRNGSLVVSLQPDARGPDVDAFLARARQTGIPVTVTAAPRPVTDAAGTVGGDPYYINGNVRCSIGFSVQGGFVSAGHCGGVGASTAGWDGSAQGTFAGSSFPGNDYSFIRIGNGWWTVPVVLGWGTVSDQLVRGSSVAAPGTSICRSGSTSHWHCGVVEGLNETVNYAQGAVFEMTRTSVCAEPGDSGGSFISGDQAQGVTSGGYGNCSSGGETWFQPVNEILRTYGLSLVTA
ncbi:S1 family peptidase [Amycolatopsis pithecellobii]|uniref:Trypsin-like serine protease n=1 Tax=Amycolatopsis pithecellobii TaxID=664692 RepID=A0A6N7Z8W0_9PSEU|nr:S1 family peptidase [Amycolatopsis pithecellobii]MTD57206.1 trypsin-like serine protease [Amycolatopsis pithecellobii]